MEYISSKINYLINNILMKVMATFEDKHMLLISITELLNSQKKFESIKRITKVLIFFTDLYISVNKVEKYKNEKHQFLKGSLFGLGNLIKIEGKSYLRTIDTKSDDEPAKKGFELMAPLIHEDNPIDEKQKKYIRKLDEVDEKFFKK